MEDFIDASKINKLVIEREGKMKIWFEKIGDDMWEVSFNKICFEKNGDDMWAVGFSEEYGGVCPVFGLWIDCHNCVFGDEEGCSGHKLRINTKAVLKLCFNVDVI